MKPRRATCPLCRKAFTVTRATVWIVPDWRAEKPHALPICEACHKTHATRERA